MRSVQRWRSAIEQLYFADHISSTN